jgi:hypothetical protein
MKDLTLERDFNRLVTAFREMESPVQFRKAALKIALNETRWGGWEKVGITEDALAVVRENLASGIHLFKGLQAAHKVSRDEYCLRLVSEDLENPYQYMRSMSACVLATPVENTSTMSGWDHFSKIHSVDPDMFGHGASNVAKKRHPSFPAFMALVKGES